LPRGIRLAASNDGYHGYRPPSGKQAKASAASAIRRWHSASTETIGGVKLGGIEIAGG
jgi:hypothetical protein